MFTAMEGRSEIGASLRLSTPISAVLKGLQIIKKSIEIEIHRDAIVFVFYSIEVILLHNIVPIELLERVSRTTAIRMVNGLQHYIPYNVEYIS